MTRKRPAHKHAKRGPRNWRGARGIRSTRWPKRLESQLRARQKELQLRSFDETVFVVVETALEAGDAELRAELARKELNQVVQEAKSGALKVGRVIGELQDRVQEQGYELRSARAELRRERAAKELALRQLSVEQLQMLAILSPEQIIAMAARKDLDEALVRILPRDSTTLSNN